MNTTTNPLQIATLTRGPADHAIHCPVEILREADTLGFYRVWTQGGQVLIVHKAKLRSQPAEQPVVIA
jgi:hypothetical protein